MFDEDKFSALSLAFQEVTGDRIEAARRYAAAGIPIFPCEWRSKAPATPHGFKDAGTEIRPVDHPKLQGLGLFEFVLPDGDNVLVRRGHNWAFEPGRIGLLIVDIDPKSGGNETWAELIAKHGATPQTLEVRTPSGGRHLYFVGTGPSTAKKLGPGIDTRGVGGYALLPPSVVKNKPYTWIEGPIAPLPQWIADALAAEPEGDDDFAGASTYEEWKASGGEGGRFEHFLSLIGDHEGGLGFYGPMQSAAGCGVRLGMPPDEIIDLITEAARNADRSNHSKADVADRIAKVPAAVRSYYARDTRRRREAEEIARELEGEAEAAEEATEKEVAEEPRPFTGGSEWISPENAIASLREPIRTWIERDRAHEKTLTILQSAAGLGKTQTMLEEQQRAELADRKRAELEDASSIMKLGNIIAELVDSLRDTDDPELLQQIKTELAKQQDLLTEELLDENLAELPPPPLGKLACAVPRHKLAEEIQAVDQELRQAEGDDDDAQIPILAGRNASNCQRYDLVVKAQKKGFEPSAMCQNGQGQQCPFLAKCGYQANQTAVEFADNVIVMHAHLAVPWLPSLALSGRKRMWMDENPSQTFIVHNEASDDYLQDLIVTERDYVILGVDPETLAAEGLVETNPGELARPFKKLAELSEILLDGLAKRPGKLRIEQHLAGWSAAELRRAGRAREKLEKARRGNLNPSLNDTALAKQIDKVRTPPRKLAALFYRLADEVEARGKGEIYSLGRSVVTGKIVLRGRRSTKKLPPNLLLTDATPSPEILAAVFSEYKQEPVQIPVRRNAFITQTSEPVFSRKWLLNEGHLPEVVDWIKRLATRYNRLVLLTTKHIRCAITGEEASPDTKLPVFFEFHGARIGHYGNLRGSNEFADCDALVILGREQPNVEDMEEQAKAIWYDADRPLRLVKPVKGGRYYLKVMRPYRMRDGSKQRGEVMVHPDPRVQAVLTATREHELVQAIDRARLIWGEPKDVYILCDIPLPGVEIDRLVPWDVLRGADRLSKALIAQAARGEKALPLVPAWLSATFPDADLFPTEKSAEMWLTKSPEIIDLFRMINDLQNKNPPRSNKRSILGKGGFLPPQVLDELERAGNISDFGLIEYRPKSQKSWSKALVWDDDPRQALAHALGVPQRELIIRRPNSSDTATNSKDAA